MNEREGNGVKNLKRSAVISPYSFAYFSPYLSLLLFASINFLF